MLLIVSLGFSQQKTDTLHSQIFSLTPLSKKVNKVNGMAFGLGQLYYRERKATINGLNLEINPAVPFVLLFLDPEKVDNDTVTLRHNGLHVSVGGFSEGVLHNGLGISVYNITHTSNGVVITGLYNVSKELNGLHIAGLTNSTDKAAGLLISAVNSADLFKGVQIGIYNKSLDMRGVQIGLYNQSAKNKGLQVGLWNSNGKRSLPFINW